ncbi:MAG TPA: dihydroxyacetone kinase subunit DhaL [Ornithinimicrobium sp.]|uniref:dihydroxyacetone kinase subunit DhaL n=1 Tax=Ornithinimicrobium sp. TaxID=1977084 RepID=UPI002C319CE0|nr:dihydroxyacetone kinase subunit DhaL [Ornithinimicrobium sp.]
MADLAAFQAWMSAFAEEVSTHAEHLTDLDRAIGDGDHGSNMARGVDKVAALADDGEYPSLNAYLKKVGMTLVSTVGGASGPLYGTFFLRMAGPLADVEDPGTEELGHALRAGVEGVVSRGKAELEDKTMYDAWAPAVEAFESSVDDGTQAALEAAAAAAARGRDSTEGLIARKGRASYLGERSRGHIDPGAASTALLLQAAARTLA